MIAPHFTLRVNFSHEDKAAKGLRSLREPQATPELPVYFTAGEVVDMYPRLLLLGERGAGKTCFARRLAAERDAALIEVSGPQSLQDELPEGGLIVDGIDRLGSDGEALLNAFLSRVGDRPVVLLGDSARVKGWRLPSGFAVHTLMPVPLDERRDWLDANGVSARAPLSEAAGNPALFALALTIDHAVNSREELVQAWLEDMPEQAERGFSAIASGTSVNRAVDDLLAAQHLSTLGDATAAELFRADPDTWTGSLQSLLRRDETAAGRLAPLLIAGDSEAALRGALLVSRGSADADVAAKLLAIIEGGRLSAFDRDQAARTLAVWGDPRDLEALCAVPGGSFTMGSDTNPNSQPVHEASVSAFRIGKYPVTNAAYGAFIAATARKWVSPEAGVAERTNAPATDLTWRDALAYCDWLTSEWRRSGRIGATETVRLPTEPEWERACRGDQPDSGGDIVYPWGKGWNPDAVNSEESGFNAPCAVGLFPAGVSPYGCYDMAGQIWEWTTTLWGSDMATPSLPYPYADDGREDPDAGPEIRRVLRGGCFSSTSLKACCTYRGSLEPDGFWRGNGFRIVVS